jgi:hypothetical protein
MKSGTGPGTATKPPIKPAVVFRDDEEGGRGGVGGGADAGFVGLETQSKRQAAKKASRAWVTLGHGGQDKRKVGCV